MSRYFPSKSTRVHQPPLSSEVICYNRSFKKCVHNNIDGNCNICNQVNKLGVQGEKVCKHWVSLSEGCYVCRREQERQKLFNNGNVKINVDDLKQDENQLKDYVDPGFSIKTYPTTSNRDMTNSISFRNRHDGNINSFMQRSLDTFGFIENNNSKNIWKNPIVNSSFPKAHLSENEIESNYLGVNTRGNRKLGNTELNSDFHLKRSMLQPDFRTGNRFFEYKPTNSRRDSHKDIGNQNVRKFQNQTEQLYKEMDHTKAYDNAAGINRG